MSFQKSIVCYLKHKLPLDCLGFHVLNYAILEHK